MNDGHRWNESGIAPSLRSITITVSPEWGLSGEGGVGCTF